MDSFPFLQKKLESMGTDDFEIYRVDLHQFSAEAKDGRIDFVEESRENGWAVRLFRGDRCGFGCSSDSTPEALEKMTRLAYQSLSLVGETGKLNLPSPAEDRSRGMAAPGTGFSSISKTAKFQMALDLEKTARAYDPRIVRVRDANYSEETRTVTLKNSRGLEKTQTRSRCELSLMAMAQEKEAQEMAWETDFAFDFSRLDPRRLATKAAEKAISQLGGKPIPTRKSAVVLDAVVAASFLGVLSSSFFGDQVRKNRSALQGREGQSIYSDRVTLADDGGYAGGYASFAFDAEGVPTGRTVLVSQGVLKNFLYDLNSSGKEGKPSTGNSVRSSFKEPPRVGATNFFIEPGSGSLEEIVGEMGTGLWVRDAIGVHTADVVTGDFSLGVSGLWVQNGKPAFPVRGITVSGNLHDLLKRVLRIGEEIRFYQSFGSPPLLVEEMDIGGT